MSSNLDLIHIYFYSIMVPDLLHIYFNSIIVRLKFPDYIPETRGKLIYPLFNPAAVGGGDFAPPKSTSHAVSKVSFPSDVTIMIDPYC